MIRKHQLHFWIHVSCCKFIVCHVMCLHFRTTARNIRLKRHFCYVTYERNGVKVSNLEHHYIVIDYMSMSSLSFVHHVVMEIGLRL